MDEYSVKYFAVFGKPILHSRSPQLYNSLFIKNNSNAFYTRVFVQSGKEVCEIIRILGLAGANITTPFKEDIIPYLDRLSPEAERISAVNTIINQKGVLTGFNTDAGGITGSLLEAGIDPSGRKCMVMGAGGAGKAAALGLVNAGADVLIANRSEAKAHDFAKKIGCRASGLDNVMSKLKSFDVLVLTLPPGIYPFQIDHVHPKLTIVDANYRPTEENPIIEDFLCKIIRGERWLLHQAVEAYHLFTGKVADTAVMEKGLKKSLDPNNLDIRVIMNNTSNFISIGSADMLIDGRVLDYKQINRIIYEERNMAFTNQR